MVRGSSHVRPRTRSEGPTCCGAAGPWPPWGATRRRSTSRSRAPGQRSRPTPARPGHPAGPGHHEVPRHRDQQHAPASAADLRAARSELPPWSASSTARQRRGSATSDRSGTTPSPASTCKGARRSACTAGRSAAPSSPTPGRVGEAPARGERQQTHPHHLRPFARTAELGEHLVPECASHRKAGCSRWCDPARVSGHHPEHARLDATGDPIKFAQTCGPGVARWDREVEELIDLHATTVPEHTDTHSGPEVTPARRRPGSR